MWTIKQRNEFGGPGVVQAGSLGQVEMSKLNVKSQKHYKLYFHTST